MAIINLGITEQRREDMLVGALEGGSNDWYWLGSDANAIISEYETKNTPYATAMWKAIKDGKSIPIRDAEDVDAVLGNISLESIEKGEQLMADNHLAQYMNIVMEEDDATTADIWFQLAVLGEVTYG